MRRFILPPAWSGEGILKLDGRQSKRLLAVLRLKAGDTFPGMDASGAFYLCTLQRISGDEAELKVERDNAAGQAPAEDVRHGKLAEPVMSASIAYKLPEVVLAPGLLKGQKLDDVVRFAAEIGVHTIQPLATARSLAQDSGVQKLQRYERIIVEALGQSGSCVPTRILPPVSLDGFLVEYPAGPDKADTCALVCHERAAEGQGLHTLLAPECKRVIVCTGPEGGFTEEEIGRFTACGYRTVWLGPSVLRAETAAFAALAAIRVLLVEHETWQAK